MDRDFEQFKMCCPHISSKTTSFVDIGHGEYFVTCNDKTKVLFNVFDKTFRYLPNDPNDLTKYECMAEFGHRLVKMLKIKNMTQRKLSEITGIQEYLISNYASGVSSPGFYNLDKIAKALGCSMDDFRYTK